jgi:methyl-accepting chemotaxis protein
MKLAHKFIINTVIFVIASIAITSSLCLIQMKNEFRHKASVDMEARMKALRNMLSAKGSEMRIADGKIMAGDYPINGNFELPDKVKEIFGGAATIFQGDLRVSTNIVKPDGSRAVGTRLQGPAYQAVIKRGKPYRGESDILGIPYFTAYDPIFDKNGAVIGVCYVGEKQSEYLAVYDRLKYMVAGIAGAVAVGLCFLSYLLVGKTLQPLGKMRDMIHDISLGNGDLTRRLDADSGDELGDVSKGFNVFVEKLHGIICHIDRTTLQVAEASARLHSTAQEMARGSENVTAQAGSVATAGEEMSTTTADIARSCATAAEGARYATQAVISGAKVVDETIEVMNGIEAMVRDSAKTVEGLGRRSEQIGEIVGTIEDIADQTNLLALNAAIEAARAGEQGRGFAVVADEVRALAERTTRATKEIGEMIKAIQQETRGAVHTMEAGVHKVSIGSSKAGASGKALEGILEQINDVTMQINQVATAAEQQTATTSEISNNMHQITDVVAQTSQGAHVSAASANQLSSLADELCLIVRQFKLA